MVILPRFNHLPPHSYPSPDSDEYDAFVRRAARTLAEAAHDEHGVGDDRPPSCLGLLEKEGEGAGKGGQYDAGVLMLVAVDER